MSQLQDLAPPLELCKLIPAGEFEYSELIYVPCSNGRDFKLRQRTSFYEASHNGIFPAPTLQEILMAIDHAGGWCPTAYRLNGYWTVAYQEDKFWRNDIVEQTDPDNPATAALKLWFKLKGIKYE